MDVPAIQRTLRDRIPLTSQEAEKIIVNQLSDLPLSVGSSTALVVEDDDEDYSAMYSLGKTFVGDAR